jgi:hypothetical protein
VEVSRDGLALDELEGELDAVDTVADPWLEREVGSVGAGSEDPFDDLPATASSVRTVVETTAWVASAIGSEMSPS